MTRAAEWGDRIEVSQHTHWSTMFSATTNIVETGYENGTEPVCLPKSFLLTEVFAVFVALLATLGSRNLKANAPPCKPKS